MNFLMNKMDNKTFLRTMTILFKNNINSHEKLKNMNSIEINYLPNIGMKKRNDIKIIKQVNEEKDVFEYFNLLRIVPDNFVSFFNKLNIDSSNILNQKLHRIMKNEQITEKRIRAFLEFKNKVMRYRYNNTLVKEETQSKNQIIHTISDIILKKIEYLFEDKIISRFKTNIEAMINDVHLENVDLEFFKNEIANKLDYEYLLFTHNNLTDKSLVYNILKNERKEISRFKLQEKINNIDFLNINSLDSILLRLAQEDFIRFTSYGIKYQYPKVENYMECYKENKFAYLYHRLCDMTLEEIGNKKGLTRERVRQICVKEIKEFPAELMHESKYRDYYASLDLTEEEFCHIFQFNTFQYTFLKTFFEKNENNINKETLFDNDWLDNMEQTRLLELINRDYLTINNHRIRRQKIDIVRYFVKSLEVKNIVLNELHIKVIEFCKENNIENEFNFTDKRSFEGIVSRLDNILWKQGKIIRYYPMEKEIIIDVLRNIEFDRYLNQEISSKVILNDYKELFDEIEIENEYELHNLMKKYELYIPKYIKFKRMPTLEIGDVNREEQVLNFLIEHSPIHKDLFAKKYSDEFGYLVSTVKANHLQYVSEYEVDGMLDADTPPISQKILDRMSNLLIEDFYFKEDILKMYKEIYGKIEYKDYMFEKMGYKNYSQFILNNKYLRADDYFEKTYFSKNMFKINDNRLKYLGSFRSKMIEMMKNFNLFEFERNEFINFELIKQKSKIRKSDIQSLINIIIQTVDDRFFTIDTIESAINHSIISELGFDDIFYESILKGVSGLRYHMIGSKHVFKKTDDKFYTDTFIEYILSKYSEIDIYDLQQYLEERYGIIISISKLIETTENTELYYHPIMERIYRDIELFYDYMEGN